MNPTNVMQYEEGNRKYRKILDLFFKKKERQNVNNDSITNIIECKHINLQYLIDNYLVILKLSLHLFLKCHSYIFMRNLNFYTLFSFLALGLFPPKKHALI